MKKHNYFETTAIRTQGVSYATFLFIAFYMPKKQTARKWKKDAKSYIVSWTDQNGKIQKSEPINYKIISSFIREHGFFSERAFNLGPMQCFWLDFTLNTTINFHRFDNTGSSGLSISDGVPQQQYGENYPINPVLNREGHSFTTMQPQLINRVVLLRRKLIENSFEALTTDWFFDLRSLINDTVSLVEITLNQIYTKGEYDSLSHWEFDIKKMGVKHGRRFHDKLKWIHQLSGKNIDAENYLPHFDKLRELRNHLMHFDPPSLIITIEEASIWMNYIIDTGYLLIKIRKAIGVSISTELVNFILQKEVVFSPEEAFKKRLPIDDDTTGYKSSIWKV